MDKLINKIASWETKGFYALMGGLIVFALLRACNKPNVEYVRSHSDTTIVQDRTVYVDRDHYNTTTRRDSVKIPGPPLTFDDSVDIWYAMEYEVFVTDSVFLYDSTGVIVFRGLIQDSLYRNRIKWREFSGRIERPTSVINNTFEPVVNYRHILVGSSLVFDGTKLSPSLDFGYRDKIGNTFDVGLGNVYKIGYKRDLFRFK